MSAVEPTHPLNRADLDRVLAYFDQTVPLSADEKDWVQRNGLGTLHAEVLRLRQVAARLDAVEALLHGDAVDDEISPGLRERLLRAAAGDL